MHPALSICHTLGLYCDANDAVDIHNRHFIFHLDESVKTVGHVDGSKNRGTKFITGLLTGDGGSVTS